jgi:hypothetical protein
LPTRASRPRGIEPASDTAQDSGPRASIIAPIITHAATQTIEVALWCEISWNADPRRQRMQISISNSPGWIAV